jgi:hypothetical protein
VVEVVQEPDWCAEIFARTHLSSVVDMFNFKSLFLTCHFYSFLETKYLFYEFHSVDAMVCLFLLHYLSFSYLVVKYLTPEHRGSKNQTSSAKYTPEFHS